jgi:pyridoxine 5-phosphate synthase
MTKLSVNINKIATLRNARGGNVPDLLEVAMDCEHFGANGITVHPRPDERHIRYKDVYELKKIVTTEFNIEGYPSGRFIDLVLDVQPHQVTLVPDAPDAITSNAGWNTKEHYPFLKDIIKKFKQKNIRTSIFVDPVEEVIEYAAKTGTDRVELYTEAYAKGYSFDKQAAIADYVKAAVIAKKLGIGLNAGHDLNLDNLQYFAKYIPKLREVSIGHALICDALYMGLEKTIKLYQKLLIPLAN